MTVAIPVLSIAVATMRPMNTPERGRAFHTIFEGVHPNLVATRYTLSGSRWKRFNPAEATRHLPYVFEPEKGEMAQLGFRRGVRGWMNIAFRRGDTPASRTLQVHYDYRFIQEHGLLEDCRRLFRNVLAYTDAVYGCMTLRTANADGSWTHNQDDHTRVNGVVIPRFGLRPIRMLRLLWLNVLGHEYIDFLGRETLESLDVHARHADDRGRLWLQITERPEEMFTPEGKAKVQSLIRQTGREGAFHRNDPCGTDREYARPEFH